MVYFNVTKQHFVHYVCVSRCGRVEVISCHTYVLGTYFKMTHRSVTKLNLPLTYDNFTVNMTPLIPEEISDKTDVMMILHSLIASVGIIANLTVVVAFVNHKKTKT